MEDLERAYSTWLHKYPDRIDMKQEGKKIFHFKNLHRVKVEYLFVVYQSVYFEYQTSKFVRQCR